MSGSELDALDEARAATRRRLRLLLGVLASDWSQYRDDFYAYKHGGLAVQRPDAAWVADNVEEVSAETPRRTPSIAVWHRGGKRMEGRGEFKLGPHEIVRTAAGTGRLALELVDAFIDSRLALFDAARFADDGSVVHLHPTQLPWTVWLREGDLAPEVWKLIGRGPRITWIRAPAAGDRLSLAEPITTFRAKPEKGSINGPNVVSND